MLIYHPKPSSMRFLFLVVFEGNFFKWTTIKKTIFIRLRMYNIRQLKDSARSRIIRIMIKLIERLIFLRSFTCQAQIRQILFYFRRCKQTRNSSLSTAKRHNAKEFIITTPVNTFRQVSIVPTQRHQKGKEPANIVKTLNFD